VRREPVFRACYRVELKVLVARAGVGLFGRQRLLLANFEPWLNIKLASKEGLFLGLVVLKVGELLRELRRELCDRLSNRSLYWLPLEARSGVLAESGVLSVHLNLLWMFSILSYIL